MRNVNRKKLKFIVMLLCLVSLFLVACGSNKEYKNKYFLLEYVPTPSVKTNSYPVEVQLSDFTIAEAYKRNHIVYRKSAHELNFYHYSQWAVKPEYLVSDMTLKHFTSSKIFETLSRNAKQDKPDFVLAGEINALEEYDNKDQWYAHLSLTLRLYDMNGQKNVWTKTYDLRKKVAQRSVVFVVRELSYILESINNDAIKEVDRVLSELYPDSKAAHEYRTAKAEESSTDDSDKQTNAVFRIINENQNDTKAIDSTVAITKDSISSKDDEAQQASIVDSSKTKTESNKDQERPKSDVEPLEAPPIPKEELPPPVDDLTVPQEQ